MGMIIFGELNCIHYLVIFVLVTSLYRTSAANFYSKYTYLIDLFSKRIQFWSVSER